MEDGAQQTPMAEARSRKQESKLISSGVRRPNRAEGRQVEAPDKQCSKASCAITGHG
jgi:hypothetical protein